VILADTSIWVDHFRCNDPRLEHSLNREDVFMHPLVLGELAMGNLIPRAPRLADLMDLPVIEVATDDEVLRFIELQKLFGTGIGYIDAHLLVAVTLTVESKLWTRDKRLEAAAARLGLSQNSP
jgi:predicted nucleic acid-binding protein